MMSIHFSVPATVAGCIVGGLSLFLQGCLFDSADDSSKAGTKDCLTDPEDFIKFVDSTCDCDQFTGEERDSCKGVYGFGAVAGAKWANSMEEVTLRPCGQVQARKKTVIECTLKDSTAASEFMDKMLGLDDDHTEESVAYLLANVYGRITNDFDDGFKTLSEQGLTQKPWVFASGRDALEQFFALKCDPSDPDCSIANIVLEQVGFPADFIKQALEQDQVFRYALLHKPSPIVAPTWENLASAAFWKAKFFPSLPSISSFYEHTDVADSIIAHLVTGVKAIQENACNAENFVGDCLEPKPGDRVILAESGDATQSYDEIMGSYYENFQVEIRGDLVDIYTDVVTSEDYSTLENSKGLKNGATAWSSNPFRMGLVNTKSVRTTVESGGDQVKSKTVKYRFQDDRLFNEEFSNYTRGEAGVVRAFLYSVLECSEFFTGFGYTADGTTSKLTFKEFIFPNGKVSDPDVFPIFQWVAMKVV